ncbi:MAG: hypothetical protein PF505_12045 [Vallitaleaceae bacterium]|jgi:adenylate kinase family enzyme|nr:hypothetical protein [Vallitaleaceae bacterium]
MTHNRIHIFGASVSGVSTLGKSLSTALDIPVYDFDDYYWLKTDPPYTKKCEKHKRYELLLNDLNGKNDFIISGHYGTSFEPLDDMLSLVVFLYVPKEIRQLRIRNRELMEYGTRILQGGDMYESHEEFVEWSGHYDDNNREGRKLIRHEQRLSLLKCNILRITGNLPQDEVKNIVLKKLLT